MRVKSIGARARPFKMAIPKPLPIPRSVSLLARKEDCDGDDCNYSSESHSIEAQSDGVHEHDVEKVTHGSGDIFGGNMNNMMEVDSMEEEETCIKCNGGGEVLFCCETGCPVALHEKCAGGEPVFDEEGKFYCPYCFYKRALARTRELRERAMEAKKALSSFLDPKVVGGDKGKGKQSDADWPYVSVLHGNGNRVDDESIPDKVIDENQYGQGHGGEETILNLDQHGGVANHEKHTSPRVVRDGENICRVQEETRRGVDSLRDDLEREERSKDEISSSSTHQCQVHEGGERVQVEDSREHEHGLCERVVEDKQQAEPSNACNTDEETNVDGSLNAKMSGDVHCRNEEQTQPQVQETFVSTRDKYERHAKKRAQNTEQPRNVDPPSKLATQLKDVAEKNARSEMENPSKESKYCAEKSSKDCVETDVDTQKSRKQQESTRELYLSRKRKRALWTAEEEEMLKKGVNIICSNPGKNIPWIKVLDFGRHVFHSSRNPAALKDKWKTMMNKMSK